MAKMSLREQGLALIESYDARVEALQAELAASQVKETVLADYSDLDSKHLAAWFDLLAHPLRVWVLQLLIDNPLGLLGVELQEACKASQALISQQTIRLEKAEVIESKRVGTNHKRYLLVVPHNYVILILKKSIEVIDAHMPEGEEDKPATPGPRRTY